MRWVLIPTFLAMATPVVAQDEDAPSLMERGAQMFLEGLMQEVEPRLDDLQGLVDRFGPAMQGFMQEMGPALADLLDQVEDWSAYHPPEMLPNGDIIIRRKAPKAPEGDPEAVEPSNPIEL